MRAGLAAALVAAVVASLGVVDGALGAGGGNATNAKLCQKGSWTKLMDASARSSPARTPASATPHTTARSTPLPPSIEAVARPALRRAVRQPRGRIRLRPGSVVTETLSKNGSAVREDYPMIRATGPSVTVTNPFARWPSCVPGNAYSASATGTSRRDWLT